MKKSNMNPTTATTATTTTEKMRYVIWCELKSYDGNVMFAKVWGRDPKAKSLVHDLASIPLSNESEYKTASDFAMLQTVKFLLSLDYSVWILKDGLADEVDLETATERFGN